MKGTFDGLWRYVYVPVWGKRRRSDPEHLLLEDPFDEILRELFEKLTHVVGERRNRQWVRYCKNSSIGASLSRFRRYRNHRLELGSLWIPFVN